MGAARSIAVVGAECSGKSTLVAALAERLDAAEVPEALRSFVDAHGRPPLQDEQPEVMLAQIAAETAAGASAGPGWVVSDAGALMTAVYSILYFGDDSLVLPAMRHHRESYALTVWCDVDLPWRAEPGHRDGPDFRQRGHQIIAALLSVHRIPALPVRGPVGARMEAVLAALAGGGSAAV